MPVISKLTSEQRTLFMTRVQVIGNCWVWVGNHVGVVCIDGIKDSVHRFGLAIVQDIPSGEGGLVVRHLCNNPKCCNPRHLTLGTRAQNNADRRIMRLCRDKHGCHSRSDCGSCKHNPLL